MSFDGTNAYCDTCGRIILPDAPICSSRELGAPVGGAYYGYECPVFCSEHCMEIALNKLHASSSDSYSSSSSSTSPSSYSSYDSGYSYSSSSSAPRTSRKNKWIAFVICYIFGIFGGHYFYVGRPGKGFLYLFTLGLFGFGWIVDIIRIPAGRFRDSRGRRLA